MTGDTLADRILHILRIYPKVSPSMLQITLNTPVNVWKPVLEDLITRRLIQRSFVVLESPSGQHRSHTILSLGSLAPVKVVELDATVEGQTDGTRTHASV